MASWHHRPLPDHSTLLSGRVPPDDTGFRSDRLQIWYNNTDRAWVDRGPHLHHDSDECFIMLRGSIVVEIEGERHTVGPREFCCFPRGVAHWVVAAHPPLESLMIRAPSVEDKEYVASELQIASHHAAHISRQFAQAVLDHRSPNTSRKNLKTSSRSACAAPITPSPAP